MKSKYFRFLLRYWLWVIILPSIAIPSVSFFQHFGDFADTSSATAADEILKYLGVAILFFLIGSGIIAMVAIIFGIFVIPIMARNFSYGLFRIIFILFSISFILIPFLIWYGLHGTVSSQYLSVVIPSYAVSALFSGLLVVRRNSYDSLVS
jgi:hypothetical protein